MPNWCYTTYKCVGDPKDIRQLHNTLKSEHEDDTWYFFHIFEEIVN